MLLTFSGISAITMLVLVANLCVHVQGATSQMKPKSLIDRTKGEEYISSKVSKHKPYLQNTNKVYSYGTIAKPNKMPKVFRDYILKGSKVHSYVRPRRQNDRSKSEELVTEKMRLHKTVNHNKRRSVSNFRYSFYHDRELLNHRKESALQKVLLLHHFMRNHGSSVHANQMRGRRLPFENIQTPGRNRFTHEIPRNFDFFHEPTRNEFVPKSIPSIISIPTDELLSYESKVEPAETYDQRINNGNFYYEPLNSINVQPNTYNGIEDSETRLSSGTYQLPDVDWRHLKHQARSYNMLPFHDYLDQRNEPVYRPFHSLDYEYEPKSALQDQEDNNHPVNYQEELPEANSQQERGKENENADYEYEETPNSVHDQLNEDNNVDHPILKTPGQDNEYETFSYEPQDSNSKLLPKKLYQQDTYVRNNKINKLLLDYQDRPAKTNSFQKNKAFEKSQDTLLDRDPITKSILLNRNPRKKGTVRYRHQSIKDSVLNGDSRSYYTALNRDPRTKYALERPDPNARDTVSEYEILKYLNKTGVIESDTGKLSASKATEILQKILKDLQMTDVVEESSRRDEFVCNVNGSWVSEVGGIRLELSPCSNDTFLRVKVYHTIPPRENGLFCKNWTFTGSLPPIGGVTGLFTLSGYSTSKKKVAVFLGQCHSCGGEDMITGTWLVGKKARNCKDTHVTINEFRDVWRKETLHNLIVKNVQQKEKHNNKHSRVRKKYEIKNETVSKVTAAADAA